MAEVSEAPTRDRDVAALLGLLNELPTVGRRRVAKQTLSRLLAPEERDGYAVLVEARKVLRAMDSELTMATHDAERPQDEGRAAEACGAAEDAVFHALNVLANHCEDERAKAVLHDV